jgi:hypothetical protein
MKTFLTGMLAAAMILFGAVAFAADEETQTRGSSTTKLEVEELKPVAEAAPAEQTIVTKPVKPRSKSNKPRAMDLDLRHCLELTDNAAIAQCARE